MRDIREKRWTVLAVLDGGDIEDVWDFRLGQQGVWFGWYWQSCRNQVLHHKAKQTYLAQVSEKLKETPWDVGSMAGPGAASHH